MASNPNPAKPVKSINDHEIEPTLLKMQMGSCVIELGMFARGFDSCPKVKGLIAVGF